MSHLSSRYFDYTCADLDKIMRYLLRDIVNELPNDVERSVIRGIENSIDAATNDIKSKITFPGRDAFDTMIKEYDSKIDVLNDKIERLDNELDRAISP